jgi:putative transposase
MELFSHPGDYGAFESILAETVELINLRVCAFCVMPTHWHFVVWPRTDGEIAEFFQRLTVTHATRWQLHRQRVGLGHVYQGRFKSFPMQEDDHFYQVARYVERNPLRANLVLDAADWRWSSLWIREYGNSVQRALLAEWPVPRPIDWRALVNQPQTEAELAATRRSAQKGTPLGSPDWVAHTAIQLGLESTLRSRGRPAKNV